MSGTEIYEPISADFDRSGNLYVLDAGNYRVFQYAANGALIGEFGRAGEGPYEFPFLRPGTASLEIAHEQAFVLMRGPQRIVRFAVPEMTPLSTLRSEAFLTTIGFDGTNLHATATSGVDGELPAASLLELTMNGDVIGSYGVFVNPSWNSPENPSVLRRRNDNLVTVGEQGRVFEAAQWWPLVRGYDLEETLLWERWLDLTYLAEGVGGELFNRPPELVADLSAADLRQTLLLRAWLILDIAASTDELFVLLSGYWISVLDAHTGAIERTYQLMPPLDANAGVERLNALSLAISKDGGRLCLPEAPNARVICYELSS